MRSPRPSTGHAMPVKDYPIEQTVPRCASEQCSGMINTRWNAGAFKPVKRLTYGLIRVSNKNQLPLCSGGLCLPPLVLFSWVGVCRRLDYSAFPAVSVCIRKKFV
jgi:hypothetical protein